MRPELERLQQRIRSGDVSQDVLDALAHAVPTDKDFEEIMGGAPSDLDSFKEVANRIRRLEAAVGTGEPVSPGEEETEVEETEVEEEPERKTVRFIDYDGTIINEVDLADLPIDSFPETPDHSEDFVPLTFTGWTTTLEKINSVTENLDVGAQYKTTDGKTHVVVVITEKEINKHNTTVELQFRPDELAPSGGDVLVDWGKGQGASQPSWTTIDYDYAIMKCETTYNDPGVYDIRINILADEEYLYSVYCNVSKGGGLVQSLFIGNRVPRIGNGAFEDCYATQSVLIPASVISIEEDAFFSCNILHGLVIPNSVTSIGKSAFSGCTSLQSLVIPESVTSIGDYVFRDCNSIERLVIPESLTIITQYAFTACFNLLSLVISNSVTSIQNNAFAECTSLENLVIGSSVTSIGQMAFQNCESLRNLVIPDNVTSIGNSVFFKCYSMHSVTLSKNLTGISGNAFRYCYILRSLVIPDGVTSIGEYAFGSCYSMQSLTIPDSVTSIGNYALSGCYSLRSLVIPDSVTSIGSYVFGDCYSLQRLVLSKNLQTVGQYSFQSLANIKELELPDTLQSVNTYSFTGLYSLQSLSIPDSLNNKIVDAFSDCFSLQNLVIGNNVKEIGSAFTRGKALKNLVIGDSVTSISGLCFNCCHFQRLVIGKKLQNIEVPSFGSGFPFYKSVADTVYIKQMPNDSLIPAGALERSDIVWGYGISVVDFEIANIGVLSGGDTLIEYKYTTKDEEDVADGEHVFSLDTLNNLTITCSSNATVTNGYVRPLVDSGTVTVTVTANDGSGYSVSKDLVISDGLVSVNMNDGQWVETQETVDGHTVYMSDAGSYQILGGESRCSIKVIGYSTLKIWAKALVGNSNYYNFVLLGKVDNRVSYSNSSSYAKRVTSSSYTMQSYSLNSAVNSTIEILYYKGNYNNGEDRAYFYFTVE